MTVVIIDSTDTLTPVQQLALKNDLVTRIDGTPVGGAIQFWRVAPTASALPIPAADMRCNPGKTVSPWVGNPANVAARYRQVFKEPLKHLVVELADGMPEAASPIMETVQAVALKVFDPSQVGPVVPKRLVVASDLIQNSPSFDQLTSVGSFETFQKSDVFQKLSAPLTNVQVEVLYLRRTGSTQGAKHIEFWQEYFAVSGGSLVGLKSIAGLS